MRSLRIRYSSSSNSRWVSSIARSPRVTSWVSAFSDQVADAQRRRAARGAAAQQRAHPRQQLLALEGLDEVVVGAGVEALHARLQRVAGGEDQDRHVVVARAALRATSRPSTSGRPRSRITRSGANACACSSAVGAVGGGAHLVALHAQRALQRLGDVLVVLDDEDAGGTGEVVHIGDLIVVGLTVAGPNDAASGSM